jgi:phosphonate transport system substrate-binding protein
MASMDRRALLISGVLGLASWPVAVRAQFPPLGRPVQVGLLPITSTRMLLGNYEPVKAYLENAMGQTVEIVTAPNFRTFHLRTIQGEYDLVVTASHMARLAQMESGWLPLVRYTAVHRTLLIATRARPLARVEDIKGGVLSGPDVVTLAAADAQEWLLARGMRAGLDYTYLETPTPSSAAHALINGQSSLAISSPQGINNTPESIRQQITVFATLPELPSLLWLANPRFAPQMAHMKSILLGLNTPSAKVAGFFEATGYQGVREVQDHEHAMADRYLPFLREALKVSR